MSPRASLNKAVVALAGIFLVLVSAHDRAQADPSKYPEFAQQTLPANITPVLINIEELLAEIKAGAKPVIVDVRTVEEFREVHILGAVSAPLGEFKDYLKSMPRDRPIVLY
jgi:3-mercaptopyruvate sulfurtransferase SseA